MRVAVIGAGAAGLVTARELAVNGHDVTVFEQSTGVGGTWAYTEATDDIDHSSMYASLRTNLPRDLMAYLDFTFDSAGGGDDHWPRYPHHGQVLTYLRRFADRFGIDACIRFGHRVDHVQSIGGRWRVATTSAGAVGQTGEFDAVALCSGHYSKPRMPHLDQIRKFRGVLVHSHHYRRPAPFRGRRVAVWGSGASGADIALEISAVADDVAWCGEPFAGRSPGTRLPTGIAVYPSPTGFDDTGRLRFADGATIAIDDFIFCTGYQYHFPFLEKGLVTVDDNWVNPLYLDIIPPAHPTLAFIGIPFLIVPFPIFQLQARWFCAMLDGRVTLPTPESMAAMIEVECAGLRQHGVRQRHFHKLGERQTAYYDLLASQCGEPPLPAWFATLGREAQAARRADPTGFRGTTLRVEGPTVVAGQAGNHST